MLKMRLGLALYMTVYNLQYIDRQLYFGLGKHNS